MAYKGISSKKSKDGTVSIYARFKHNNKTYPVKNLTKLFGCKTEKQGRDKLEEIKILISQGKNPFNTTINNLNVIFEKTREEKYKSGEWSKTTYDNYGYFYHYYVEKIIGHLKLEKITYEKLLKVQEQVQHLSNSSKNYLRMILKPIFEEEVKKGNISENVVAKLKYHGYSVRESLETRIQDNHLDVIRKLYKEIPNYIPNKKNQREELKYFLYLTILTAHRYGEILQLTKEDCYMKEGLIKPPEEITKTDSDYRFPIPKECYNYINNIKSGLLFPNLKRGGIYAMFKKFIEQANIKFYKGKSISLHDTRRFLLTIMIRDCGIDSVLADTCLNHQQKGIIRHYLSFTYEDKKNAYYKYWEVIREKT